MKLSEIDFRVWSKLENRFIECPVINFREDKELEYWTGTKDVCGEKEVEFWSGLRDLNNAKIYEGDIVAHYAEGGGIEYYSKVVFNQEKGAFEFVCIEHPITTTFDELENVDIGVVGNIHENPELLGGEKGR